MSSAGAAQAQALQHVRVLDLSRVLAGPWAAQTLGDLGAEVIKIERPKTGDDTRAWGPPYVTDAEGEPTGESAYYMCTNRNKQSVTVDFTQPQGQALVLPAYDLVLKASHLFNLMNARGAIAVAERASYIGRIRDLCKACASAWVAQQEEAA